MFYLMSACLSDNNLYDLLVVGLGPAGVSCALQAFRDGLKVLAIGDEPVGGLVPAARKLSNLPAAPGISGSELAQKMDAQLRQTKVDIEHSRVIGINRSDIGFIALTSGQKQLAARTICLATGTRPRKWNVANGSQGIARDCRGLDKNLDKRQVVVVGGGEAALDTALTAKDRGALVEILVRSNKIASVDKLIEEVRAADIKIHLGVEVEKVVGRPGGYSMTCSDGLIREANDLVVCIGRTPEDDLLEQMIPEGFENSVLQSKIPGLVLAGDLIRGRDRYVATAIGDGQRAAVAIANFIKEEA
jgi:thioredoxin reductase (NADPH)